MPQVREADDPPLHHIAVAGVRVKHYVQFRDRATGRFITEDIAKALPPRRVLKEQRRILTPAKVDSVPAAA